MKCTKCLKEKRVVHRTKPKGQNDAGWMCVDCIQGEYKELAKELQNDKVLNDIINATRN